jgi:hypothetical protein
MKYDTPADKGERAGAVSQQDFKLFGEMLLGDTSMRVHAWLEKAPAGTISYGALRRNSLMHQRLC